MTMDNPPSNTIASFVNMDWIFSLCEEEILNERLIYERIGGRVNTVAQAELRGFIRAIRKIQELTLLSITEEAATISCDAILDEKGDILLLDAKIVISGDSNGSEAGSPQQQRFEDQGDAITRYPVLPWLTSMKSRK